MAEGETVEHHEVHEVHETAPVIEAPPIVEPVVEAAHEATAQTADALDGVTDAVERLGDEAQWRETHDRLTRIETTLAEIRGSLSNPTQQAPRETSEAFSDALTTPLEGAGEVLTVEESPPAKSEEASRKRSGRLGRRRPSR